MTPPVSAGRPDERGYRKVPALIGKYLLFLGPAALLYVPFVLRPMVETFILSFHEWNGVAAERKWVGLDNYLRALGDPIFWKAISNNITWVFASIALPMCAGLVLATLLSRIHRGQRIYSGIFFAPAVLNLIIVGLAWGLLYNPLIGPLGSILRAVGLGGLAQGWLGNQSTATAAIILAGNWTFFGICTVIFLQGLRSISPELLEAATLDGAGPIARFFNVIVPSLSNQVTLVVVLSIIGSFKVFDIVYVMTKGGPNNASEVIATYMYWQSFMNGRLGYGAALAVLLTIIVSGASLLMVIWRERHR